MSVGVMKLDVVEEHGGSNHFEILHGPAGAVVGRRVGVGIPEEEIV